MSESVDNTITYIMSGGRKIARQVIGNITQQQINDQHLYPNVPPEAFEQESKIKLECNTTGIICRECKSSNVHVQNVQLRSGDEAMTKFYTCLDCQFTWRVD